MNVCFDTLRFKKSLVKGGYTEEQAECTAEAWIDALTDNIATKKDLLELKIETYKIIGISTGFLTTVIGIASGIIIHFVK